MVVGEAMMHNIVTALGASPQWNRTLLIVNYDEHGGYFDHVPPPPALAPDNIAPIPPAGSGYFQYEGFRRYGFRVPAVVVSPYAKKNHVSHLVYDQSSVLALLQRKWNLPALTMRDANALDMTDFIDLEALSKGEPTFPDMAALNLSMPGNTTEALACTPDNPGEIPPPESVQAPVAVVDKFE
jgi:phospholipase C